MTPQSVTTTADGNCTKFTFDFPVFEPLEIEVLLGSTLQTSGYGLLGCGANSGGAVVFATAPANGTAVTLRRAGKVQVSGSDAPGFLEAKIIAGSNVSVTKTSDSTGEHLVIAADADPADFLSKAQNLADLPDAATARSNLGLAAIAASGSASDLIGGTVPAARLPNPGASTLGGVRSHAPESHQFLTGIGTDGIPVAAQPAAADVSGLAAVAISGSYADLSDKPSLGTVAALNVDTDATLSADSDSRVPSQKAVKAYVAATVLPPQNNILMLEKDVMQSYLLNAINGGWSAGQYANGAYDGFNTDTIGGNSTNQTYDSSGKLYGNPSQTLVSYSTGTAIGNMTSDGGIAAAFNGSYSETYAALNSCQRRGSPGSGYVGKDWGAGVTKTLNGVKIFAVSDSGIGSGGGADGKALTWALRGSNDGSNWTSLYSSGTLSLSAGQNISQMSGINTSTPYRYHSVLFNTGVDANPILAEVEFYENASPLSMTLVSNALSPAPSSAPASVKLMVLHKAIDAVSLNTDVTAEATRTGSTWTAGTLVDSGITVGGFKVLWTEIDVSGQSSGTTVKYRLKTLNAKHQQVKGVALMVG